MARMGATSKPPQTSGPSAAEIESSLTSHEESFNVPGYCRVCRKSRERGLLRRLHLLLRTRRQAHPKLARTSCLSRLRAELPP